MDRRTFLTGAAAGAALAGLPLEAGAATKRITWRMVTSWPPGLPILQTGAERLARLVSEMSKGRFQINVYAGGELVPPLGVFDAVSQGTVQCGHSASYYWAGKNPVFQWFTSVPFGMNAQGMNSWFYYGNGLKLWEQAYSDYNLVPRPAGNTGVQMGGWFNKEIKSVSDFKGLKMRIPGLGGKVISRLGGTVVLLPGGEIYTSPERGVIDATEWVGPAHDLKMGFDKVAKYYYAPGWHEPGSALELCINKKAYEALPQEFRSILDTATARVNLEILSEFETANAAGLQRVKRNKKVEIRTFPKAVLAALRKASTEVLEEIAGKNNQIRSVHEDFKRFAGSYHDWSGLGEKAYHEMMEG